MKTIDRLLIYEFSYKEKRLLLSKWIVNWCGGKKGFKFDYLFRIAKWIIWKSNKIRLEKVSKLFKDMKLLCSFTHDIDFYLWWWIKEFYKANIVFIIWILQLLHWSNWYIKILIFILLFLWLNIFWLFHFHFTKNKRTIENLFTNLE